MEKIQVPEGMNAEVIEHLMYPKNYGKLDAPNCIGIAMDEKTNEYVIFYSLIDGDIVKDVSYATNGCQDTVVVGSMFTDMIKGETVEYAHGAIEKMGEKLGVMTPQQQICAEMVLNAFVASMMNLENLAKGEEEEVHILKMKESCEVPEEGEKNE